jgi:UDP-N-acetylmuramoyl-L-alanyl-D-glutamate--2,6-diaminopimelate ligase
MERHDTMSDLPLSLHDLVRHLPGAQVRGPAVSLVRGLAYDSRQVQPGGMFVAIKGYHTDGHRYIAQAIERGAAVVVVDARHGTEVVASLPPEVACVVVPDSRVALAPLAAAFYGFPGQHLGVVGITGTKGKTTTTTLIARALESGGHSTGIINSVDFQVGTRQWPNTTRQSTPEAPDVQALLREMVAAGCGYAVIEATSHALSEHWRRVDGCAFDVAVFTNISHEHLDYHGSFEQYRRDKARLFAMLGDKSSAPPAPPAKARTWAIVNADDPQHTFFLDAAPAHAERLTYALYAPADVRAHITHAAPDGAALRVETPWGAADMRLSLPGTFNAANALAALCVALSQGVPLHAAAQALEQVRGVRGRMERIDQGQPFSVIVDYAHNPDSFEQVMGMLRPVTAGRLIAVFGSAGERDREKRPLQGEIAARFCDLLILTDEDPRAEDREQILAEIAAGATQAGKVAGTDCLSIPDRPEAIRAACEHARPGDVVLLLGKGHETSIEYADGKHPWNEVAEARAALRALGWQAEGP